jgi:tetratricopeptide (TPR) repeat protein
VAAARLHLDRLSVGDAGALLEVGLRHLPGDALVLCESGRLAEYRARTLVELGPSSPRWLFGQDDIRPYQSMRSKRRTLLTRAAGWLRKGVETDPDDAVCGLHLGRVLSLLGEDDEADPILAALQQNEDAAVSYLASMFLGGAAERRGHVAEAEPFYRAAAERFGLGQAAHVALSAVRMRSGRVTDARAALAQAVNGVPDDRRDPWWWYHLDPTAAVEARIEALVKEGRQALRKEASR